MERVQLKQLDGRSAIGSCADDVNVINSKMIAPVLTSRIKQPCHFTRVRVDGTQIASFAKVAQDARKSQVVQCCGTAVFLGDDMIDLMRRKGIVLVNQTVFTPVIGSFGDLSPYLR